MSAGRKIGIGEAAMAAIRAGMTNAQALSAVRAEFPGAQTTLQSINSYRSKLRSAGEDVPLNSEIEGARFDGAESEDDASAEKRRDESPGAPDSGRVKNGEELEGLDSEKQSWGDYPLNDVLIRDDTRSIYETLRRIKQGNVIMNPDFQRDFIWPNDKQSKLIESVMMRIPLPVFYMAENDEGKMIVVDGLQRLSTFQRFADDDLPLSLNDREDLHRKRFSDLPPKFQNRFEDFKLVFYLIDSKVPERARLDIFERVNGGVPLTRQQMRNCLFMGSATQFMKEESQTEIFSQATGGSLNRKTMRDREFVNRFCAFQILGYESYNGDMDDFLARCLQEMNGMSESTLSDLSERFRQSLANNLHLFGRHAFRKHTPEQNWRSVINASLWDVMSTGLSGCDESLVEKMAVPLRREIYGILEDEEFINSITYSTNSTVKVQRRFDMTREIFAEVLGC